MPNAERTRELSLGPLPPWHTVITVDAVTTNHGRQSSLPHDHLFEVAAEWVGPAAIGMPYSLVPVSGRDVCVVTSLEEAKQLAHKAAEAFRQGGEQAPDLRDFLNRNTDAFARHAP
jgi:hypothetical protein